jgi:hypothetical protein
MAVRIKYFVNSTKYQMQKGKKLEHQVGESVGRLSLL